MDVIFGSMLVVGLVTAIAMSIGPSGMLWLVTWLKLKLTPSPKTKTEPTACDSRDS